MSWTMLSLEGCIVSSIIITQKHVNVQHQAGTKCWMTNFCFMSWAIQHAKKWLAQGIRKYNYQIYKDYKDKWESK